MIFYFKIYELYFFYKCNFFITKLNALWFFFSSQENEIIKNRPSAQVGRSFRKAVFLDHENESDYCYSNCLRLWIIGFGIACWFYYSETHICVGFSKVWSVTEPAKDDAENFASLFFKCVLLLSQPTFNLSSTSSSISVTFFSCS